MSLSSGRPNTRVSTAASSAAATARNVTPILYGRFPRRFLIRSTPRASPFREWEKYEQLPASYRPYTGRKPQDLTQIRNHLNRLNRPTVSSQAKMNYPWTKDAKVVCTYSWNNAGIATFRDTVKCVYDVNGGVKQTSQRSNNTRY